MCVGKKKYPALCLSLLVSAAFTCASSEIKTESINPGVTSEQLSQQLPVHWVSVPQIARSLQHTAPIAVGFDIDDTLLYSSPGFYRGQQQFSPGSEKYLTHPQFWENMNNGWDAFSIPKQSAKQLIALHLQRGDDIWFITARSASATETLSALLQKTFQIPANKMHPVVFTGTTAGKQGKIKAIKDRNIALYYGDADSDIRAAQAANARGIRVLRPANSTYQPLPHAGDLGEEVLINSDR